MPGALRGREINPDIFGSMIQEVADDEERGALGMHYTSAEFAHLSWPTSIL